MIGTTNKTIFACLKEIIIKILVKFRRTFRCLYHYKTYRASVYHCIREFLPVYISLIMRNINALYFVSFRIFGISIEGAPTKSLWPDEEIIKSPYIKNNYTDATTPPRPAWEAMDERQFLSMASVSSSFLHYSCSNFSVFVG